MTCTYGSLRGSFREEGSISSGNTSKERSKKIQNLTTGNLDYDNLHCHKLGPYLAGLIEGDGSIIVPDAAKRHALIRIAFASKD